MVRSRSPGQDVRCVNCGSEVYRNIPLCPYHDTFGSFDSASNRIMCDFFHRKIVPKRVPMILGEIDDAHRDPTQPQQMPPDEAVAADVE